MPLTDFRDLRCWQLAHGIRLEVIALCAKPELGKDFKFCDGFRNAAGSVCRNIGEGFTRFESAEIVQFFRYALASLAEVQDYLVECQARGALEPSAASRLLDQCDHTRAMMLRFIKPHQARSQRRRRRST